MAFEDATFRDDKTTRRYIDTAICRNIQHSLVCCKDGGHFRHLRLLYESGELTGTINRIIEDANHAFLVSVLTRDFRSHDLGLAARKLRKERDPEKRTNILDETDAAAVTERLMNILEIRNKREQTVEITKAHAAEIKEYLAAPPLRSSTAVRRFPSESDTCGTPRNVRLCGGVLVHCSGNMFCTRAKI